ncbi:hypothetical protein QBC40DRAFT_177996 [Triangularia verruculosa]|uniref:Uncharacterized protein n=1 Tax=Triangularia verruculosa TaxID=2587418 RepID=A0AAN6XEH6_9PEZI|nr:hypothetical protein QBC40DRAFT_177996 [Triangularia verruculosa]
MSYNIPGAYPSGEREHARLARQLAYAKEDLELKKGELASAMHTLKVQKGEIFDLNYKVSLSTQRAEAAENCLRQTAAQHRETLDELHLARQAYSNSAFKIREAERARDEVTEKFRQMSLVHCPMVEELAKTRQTLSSTEAWLKEAVAARDEARKSLNLSRQLWDCEKDNLGTNYKISQTQLATALNRAEVAEVRIKEFEKVAHETGDLLVHSVNELREAQKYRHLYRESEVDVQKHKVLLANLEIDLQNARKARDAAAQDLLKIRFDKLANKKEAGFVQPVEVRAGEAHQGRCRRESISYKYTESTTI